MGRDLPLAADDHGDLGDNELVARRQIICPPAIQTIAFVANSDYLIIGKTGILIYRTISNIPEIPKYTVSCRN